MIIDKEKLIFIHIPKTAGTSVKGIFNYPSNPTDCSKHDDIYFIKKRFPKKYNNYRKFTIVRNPYDRMVSWYFYYKTPDWISVAKKSKRYNIDDYSFENWIKKPKSVAIINIPEVNMKNFPISRDIFDEELKPQYDFIDNTVNVLKYENLNKELSVFLKKKINLPTLNKSNHDHYLKYYNEETLNIVFERYKKDFEKFNYKKL
tara:strand:+ start:327 stop:935 length:609 start_codon:yes stop_codon:yes gene_type:complete